MRHIFGLLLFLVLLPPASASSEEYCLSSELVVDKTALWNFGQGVNVAIPLPTHRMDALVPTAARALVRSAGGSGTIELAFDLPAKPGEVGLEYNVYRVELQIGLALPDEQLLDLDFTYGCRNSPFSFFPGERRGAGIFPLARHANGSPRGLEIVRVRIWGRR